MTLVWSPRALERVDEIARFIARDNPRASRRWVDRLFSRTATLSCFPHRGRQVPEIRRPEIREILFPPYRIIYRLEASRISILTVRHGMQRLEKKNVMK